MDGPIPAFNPAALRLARAYGPAAAGVGTTSGGEAKAHADAVRDEVTLSGAGSLVAARVAHVTHSDLGKALTSSLPAEPSRDALPMYTNPAAKNAAATGVTAGKMIDVVG
jgi:hypothetical protein